MRVNPETTRTGAGQATGQVNRANQASRAGAAAGAGETRESDEAVLSPQAKDVLVAQKAISQTPETRDQLVESIKSQIASGTFTVDEEMVAERIIQGGL